MNIVSVGPVRISVCEGVDDVALADRGELSCDQPLSKTYCTFHCMLPGSIKAPVPPSRPAARRRDQVVRRLIARKRPPRLDDLAWPGIDVLDRVGGANRRWEADERDYPVPG